MSDSYHKFSASSVGGATEAKRNENRAERARRSRMTEEELEEEEKDRKEALANILKADSVDYMIELMDSLIDEEWTAGLEALPGNIYSIMALDPIGSLTGGSTDTLKSITGYLGFLCIFAIQIVGPPLIAASFLHAWWTDTDEDRHSLNHSNGLAEWADWTPDGAWKKLLTLLFLVCFGLNGLFAHLDEGQACMAVDRVMKVAHHNSDGTEKMTGTKDWLFWLGYLVNAWVAVWCSIDAFIVCSTAQCIADLLMNAFALMFLYNLDDVGGDMSFVNHDDWPGLGLAWVARETEMRADDDDRIDDYDASNKLKIFQHAVTGILIVLNIVLPICLIMTPIKDLVEFYGN